jgi:REP element-mobilizing transposase RayT
MAQKHIFDPSIHHRRSIRLKGYDYSQAGAYFITICTFLREHLLGEILDGEMRLNTVGEIVINQWRQIPDRFANVLMDEFVVMPNHVHRIVMLCDRDGVRDMDPNSGFARTISKGEAAATRLTGHGLCPTAAASPRRPHGTLPGSVGAIVQNFKSVTARKINIQRHTPGVPVWQRNYYEHIIRSERSYQQIAAYIAGNPARWQMDALYAGGNRDE